MAITLANYYEQYANGDNTGLYSQPGGPTIPNPNDPNNNSTAQYGGVTFGGFNNDGTNPAPLITVPVTQGAIGNSGEGLLSSLSGGGLSSIPGVGGLGGGLLNIVDGATGGIVEELAAGALDAARITKFLATPQGIAFNLKQVWLQAMNTKVPHSGLNNDTRIYNLGINTLLQVPLEAIDIHIERHGLFPSFQEYPNNKGVYSQYYSEKNKDASNDIDDLTGVNNLIKLYSGIDGPTIGGEWYSYGGGPKSIFGIGRTSQKRWVNSNEINVGVINIIRDNNGKNATEIVEYRDDVISSSPKIVAKPTGVGETEAQEFMDKFRIKIAPKSRRYTNTNLSTGDRGDTIDDITLVKGTSLKNNRRFTSDLSQYYNQYNKNIDDAHLLRDAADMVDFRFEAIDNDSPTESIFMLFRSYLSSIQDTYSPTWNPHKYLGRGEKVYTYSGFDRSFGFSFKMAPMSRKSVKPLIQKLNFLASNTAPDYNTAGRMRGSFMRLTIGDYIVGLPGFISSLSYSIDDNSPWDIALYEDLAKNENEFGKNERQLPHMITVSVSYTPIHDFLPRKDVSKSPFILRKEDPWYNVTEIERERSFEEIPVRGSDGVPVDPLPVDDIPQPTPIPPITSPQSNNFNPPGPGALTVPDVNVSNPPLVTGASGRILNYDYTF